MYFIGGGGTGECGFYQRLQQNLTLSNGNQTRRVPEFSLFVYFFERDYSLFQASANTTAFEMRGNIELVPNNPYGTFVWQAVSSGSTFIVAPFTEPSATKPYCYKGVTFGPYSLISECPAFASTNSVTVAIIGGE